MTRHPWSGGRAALVMLALVAAGRPMRAQLTADTAIHHFHVGASSLRPGQFLYRTTIERDTTILSVSTRAVLVSEAIYAGTPTWLVVERREGTGLLLGDTVNASKTDLRPMHWASTIGGARLVVEFAADSLYGVVIAPTGRRSMVAPLPAGTVINSAMLETMLRLAPLQLGWQDSTVSLSITVGRSTTAFTRLAVIGEGSVIVPAGTFDCWIVTATSEAGRATYWVTKQDPVVVRSTQPAGGAIGTLIVNELTAMNR